MDTKKLLGIQSLLLFGGTIFAWSKLIPQFSNFHALYGTLFRFNDCVVPNPFLTACLYGSMAFLVALYWSVRVYQNHEYISERRLRNFLLFCVAFAGSVVAYEAVVYYHLFGPSTTAFICTPGVHPLQTPCFYGMLFFIAAFITSIFSTRRLKSVPGTVI
jgi:hypothetical protein